MANGKSHFQSQTNKSTYLLTPFEEYLLAEDRVDYPCWIVVNFIFDGRFERGPLQLAFEKVLSRHPLLRSVLRKTWRGLAWQEDSTWCPQIEWIEGLAAGEWPKWSRFDLNKEPGFRLTVIDRNGRSEMISHFHHAICDGKALRDVMYDILNHYAILQGQPVETAVLRPEIFGDRNRFGSGWMDRVRALKTQSLGLFLTWRFQRKKISPLAENPSIDSVELPAEYPALLSRRFPESKFRKVRDEAKAQKVSVNDLFLRNLFYAIGQWKKVKNEGDPEDWIRIVIPVDMRKPLDRFLSAANLTSIVTLDRRLRSLGNREKLLQRAHEDMDWVKNKGMRFAFWTWLRMCKLIPHGIQRMSHRSGCHGTIIFANHCQLVTRSPLRNKDRKLEVPGAVLIDMKMVSPIRPGTTAALVVGTYAGDLCADLHYDPRFHSAEDAGKLLDLFIEQIG